MLGYAMSDNHDSVLIVASLRMAAATRGGDGPCRVRVGQCRSRVVQLHAEGRVRAPAPFATRAEARIKIAPWIADFCNTTRQLGGFKTLAHIVVSPGFAGRPVGPAVHRPSTLEPRWLVPLSS